MTTATPWPRIAVVIPAYNEERHLGRCLASVRDLDFPADRVEVVVVDNGSRDRTLEIARSCGVRAIAHPGVKVGGVRNRGVVETASDLVAFLDADCVAPRTWLRAAVTELGANPATGLTGGNYLVAGDANWLERAWASRPRGARRVVKALAGGSMIMARDLYITLGGFDASLNAGEDEDLCRRVAAAGREVVSLPECAVVHLGFPRTLADVYRRQRWQGSSQLESARSPLDRVLLMVHLFAAAVISLPVVAFAAPRYLVAPLAVVVAVPAMSALYRSSALRTPGEGLLRPARLWVVFFFYYLGRTAGLALNYLQRLTGSDRKVGKKA